MFFNMQIHLSVSDKKINASFDGFVPQRFEQKSGKMSWNG